MKEAIVNQKKLLLNEVITFKRSNLYFKGKILEFKQINPDSIWAKVMNVADVKDTEWISLNNWYEYSNIVTAITEKAPIVPAFQNDNFPIHEEELPDWL